MNFLTVTLTLIALAQASVGKVPTGEFPVQTLKQLIDAFGLEPSPLSSLHVAKVVASLLPQHVPLPFDRTAGRPNGSMTFAPLEPVSKAFQNLSRHSNHLADFKKARLLKHFCDIVDQARGNLALL